MIGRRAASGIRRFSSKAAGEVHPPSAPASVAPSPAVAVTASDGASSDANTSTLPPWLHRALHLWDRESGTHEILRLKRRVESSSAAFDAKQRQVAEARTKLDGALHAFEEGQVQHGQLLQSRDRWTPQQAMEFAKLLEKEVVVRKELEGAKKELATLEAEQLAQMNGYMNDLRRRYQEEQLWQDRWRIYSTFGTWGLIVLNSLVFLASQYMWRVREARRSEEVRGLLRQSLAVHERIANEEKEEREQVGKEARAEKESVASSPEKEVSGEEGAARNTSRAPKGASGVAEESALHKSSTDTAGTSESDHLREEESPSYINWTRIRQYAHTATRRLMPQTQQAAKAGEENASDEDSKSHVDWTRIRQNARDASKKLLLERERIDVPSAVLGASATGLAWLVAGVLSSRKGAQ